MDEIERLQREIDELNRGLRNERSKIKIMQNNLQTENTRKLKELRHNLEKMARDNDALRRTELNNKINEYERLVRLDIESELRKVNSEYKNLERSVERYKSQLESQKNNLQKAFEKLKTDMETRGRKSKEEAEKYIIAAEKRRNEIDKLPHEKFMSGRMDIILSSLEDASYCLNQGVYEASLGIAISIISALNNLGFDVKEKQAEWENFFNNLKERNEELLAQLSGIEGMLISLGAAENDDDLGIDLDYWTYDAVKIIRDNLDDNNRLIDEVQRNGVDAYLKQSDSMEVAELKDRITILGETELELIKAEVLLKNVYDSYLSRTEVGCILTDFFVKDYNWHLMSESFESFSLDSVCDNAFRSYAEKYYSGNSEVEDFRGFYQLIFKNVSNDKLVILIVPEKDDLAVYNEIYCYLDFSGAYIANLRLEIVKIIDRLLRDNTIHGFTVKPVESVETQTLDVKLCKVTQNIKKLLGGIK